MPPTRPPSEDTAQSEYEAALRGVMDDARRMEAVQEQREEAKIPPLRRPPIVLLVTAVFLSVAAWNVYQWQRPPPPPAAQAGPEAHRQALLATGMAVEAFYTSRGRLPDSLPEAGVPPGVFSYQRVGDGYLLEVTSGETSVRIFREEVLEALGGMPRPTGGSP